MFSSFMFLLLPAFATGAAVFHPMVWEMDGKIQNLLDDTKSYRPTIVGGVPVTPPFKYGQWLVAITRNRAQFCAGTLVAPNVMVTAAHCSILGFPVDSLTVMANRHDLSRDESEEVEMKVLKISVHPGFSWTTLRDDVAVWFLSGGDSLEVNVQLDDGSLSSVGDRCNVMGWGALEEGGAASDVLMQLDVDVVANDKCQSALSMPIANSMICAGGIGGRDACQGDSGGPLIAANQPSNAPTLVGIVSWGKGCARSGYPGVYTRVSDYRDFIQSQVSESAAIFAVQY